MKDEIAVDRVVGWLQHQLNLEEVVVRGWATPSAPSGDFLFPLRFFVPPNTITLYPGNKRRLGVEIAQS